MTIGLGLSLRPSGRRVVSTPAFLNFASSASGDPIVPAHGAGNLMVGSILRTGGTAAVPSAGGWTFWGAGTSAGNAWSIYWKIAQSSGETWGTWSQTGRRNLWLFSGAQIGHVAGFTGTGTATVNWPALNSGASLGGASLVCASLFATTAQTSASAKGPALLTTERLANTTALVADGGTTSFATFASTTRTLDTSSNHVGVLFSILGV